MKQKMKTWIAIDTTWKTILIRFDRGKLQGEKEYNLKKITHTAFQSLCEVILTKKQFKNLSDRDFVGRTSIDRFLRFERKLNKTLETFRINKKDVLK